MSLRILSGKYKNRQISFSNNDHIRPTLVRARKVIFDTVMSRVPTDFSFLDVFAGSGIMGMEALSRGSERVVFFDLDTKALKKIEENLKKMDKIEGGYHIVKANALKPPTGMPVDIIFIDPPYDKSFIVEDVIKKLLKYNWIKEGTHLIIESHKKTKINLSEQFFIYKEKQISSTSVNFYTYGVDISRETRKQKEQEEEDFDYIPSGESTIEE